MKELLIEDVKPLQHPEVLCQEIGDEMLIYPLEGSAMHVLNRTAFAVWNLCDGEHTVAQIEQAIREQFVISDPHANILADVRNTLEQLIEKELVSIS